MGNTTIWLPGLQAPAGRHLPASADTALREQDPVGGGAATARLAQQNRGTVQPWHANV